LTRSWRAGRRRRGGCDRGDPACARSGGGHRGRDSPLPLDLIVFVGTGAARVVRTCAWPPDRSSCGGGMSTTDSSAPVLVRIVADPALQFDV